MALTTANWSLLNVYRFVYGRKIFLFQPAILAGLILLILAFDGEIYLRYAYRNIGRADPITHNQLRHISNVTITKLKQKKYTHHPKAPHDFANISHSTRHNLKHAHPLSPREVADISEKLASSSHPPRMLQPWRILAGKRAWTRKERENDIPKDAWDAIADDVAIAVKTGSEVAEERLEALQKFGWLSVGRRVPNLLVVADAPFSSIGVIDVKRYAADILVGALRTEKNATLPPNWFNREGWDGDKDKNLPTLHLLKSTFPKAKWYILIDDDTYLFLDNFAKYVNSLPLNEAIYSGKAFRYILCGDYDRNGEFLPGRKKAEYGVFGHGGSGIFINNVAMNRMFPSISECIRLFSDCYAGDMQVSFCLERVGVTLQYEKRSNDQDIFTMFSFSRAMADSRYTELMHSSVKPVTFHKIAPRETELIATFDGINARSKREFKYKNLRLYLQAKGIKPVFEDKPTGYDTRVFLKQ